MALTHSASRGEATRMERKSRPRAGPQKELMMIGEDDVHKEVREQLSELHDGTPPFYCDACVDRAIDLATRRLPQCDDPAEIAGVAIDTLLEWELANLAERAAAEFEWAEIPALAEP